MKKIFSFACSCTGTITVGLRVIGVLAVLSGASACHQMAASDYVGKAAEDYKTGRYDAAVTHCTKAIELGTLGKNDLAIAYGNRGMAYRAKEQYDRAIEDYTKAIELKPKDAWIYNNRGVAYKGKKEYDRGIRDFDKAIELDPKNVYLYYNKACVYSLMNNAQDSCRWLGTAVEKGFTDWNAIKADPDFNNIRNSACYKGLMAGK